MFLSGYEILAYSPSRNQEIREFDQNALSGQHTQLEREAQMKADSLAARQNQKSHEPKDWVGPYPWTEFKGLNLS